MTGIWQDVKWAVSSLRRARAFSAMAILVMSLGIGATTAVFSVVNAVLLRPLPYREPDRLVAISSVYKPESERRSRATVRLKDLEDWRASLRSFASVGAFTFTQLPLRVGNGAFSPVTALMDPEFLPTLGVPLALGYPFTKRVGHSAPTEREVIISHRLWVEAFGSDRGAIRRTVLVDGEPYVVTGVLSEEFQFPRSDASYFTEPVDMLLPAASYPAFPAEARQWFGIGRLAPGVTTLQAESEMMKVARASAATPDTRDWGVRVTALSDETTRDSRASLAIVLGISLLLLLIAATNAMNLFFSRGIGRLHEMAIRRAMGSTPHRVVRQLTVEAGVVALASGAAGLVMAAFMANALVDLSPVHLPVSQRIGVDGTVLGFTALAVLVTALMAGAIPAVHVSASSAELLRSPSTRTTGGRTLARLQRTLCVVQIALGVGLLSGASMLAHSLWNLNSVDPGFRADGLIGFNVSMPSDKSLDERRRYYLAALEQVRAIPGVTESGWITFLPPEPRSGVFLGVNVPDAGALPPDAPARAANHLVTSPGYFGMVGMSLVEGRDFADGDDDRASPVAIVNEAFVKKYLSGSFAVGRRVGTGVDGGEPVRTIVGVVRDARDRGVRKEATPTVYLSVRQFTMPYGAIVARTALAPSSIVPEIRQRLSALDASVPLTDFQTIRQRMRESLQEPRFYTLLAASCAAMAILFVALGLYGVIALAVSRRTTELGIRMAVGATQGSIRALVVRDAARMLALGLLFGIPIALALGQVLRSMLFQVPPADPLTLGAVVLVVALVTLGASYVPARRASRVNPLTALRTGT